MEEGGVAVASAAVQAAGEEEGGAPSTGDPPAAVSGAVDEGEQEDEVGGGGGEDAGQLALRGRLLEDAAAVWTGIERVVGADFSIANEQFYTLEAINRVSSAQYADMAGRMEEMCSFMQRQQQKADALEPLLGQIAVLEGAVKDLGAVVGDLDAYSQRLEAQWKKAVHK